MAIRPGDCLLYWPNSKRPPTAVVGDRWKYAKNDSLMASKTLAKSVAFGKLKGIQVSTGTEPIATLHEAAPFPHQFVLPEPGRDSVRAASSHLPWATPRISYLPRVVRARLPGELALTCSTAEISQHENSQSKPARERRSPLAWVAILAIVSGGGLLSGRQGGNGGRRRRKHAPGRRSQRPQLLADRQRLRRPAGHPVEQHRLHRAALILPK